MLDPMKYGKARGAELARKYFPKNVPFGKLTILETLDDWLEVKDNYGKFVLSRIDWPVGAKTTALRTIGASGNVDDIPRLIEAAQAHGGVVLLMEPKNNCPRYDYDGGFNVLFNVDHEVIIEFVGKGFDAHEITQGLAVHERYIIPWGDIPFVGCRDKLREYGGIVVNDNEYAAQRKERFGYLVDGCNYSPEDVEAGLPTSLEEINVATTLDFIANILFEAHNKRLMLLSDGLKEFSVQGNFVNWESQPWEIYTGKR